MKKLLCSVVLLALGGLVPASHAQDGPRPPAPNSPRPEQRFSQRSDMRGDASILMRDEVLQALGRNPQILERLQLSDDQKEQLRAVREDAREIIESYRAEMEESRRDLMEKMSDPSVPDAELRTAFEASQKAEMAMRTALFDIRLKVRGILGPEKLRELAGMVREMRPGDRFRDGANSPSDRPAGDRPDMRRPDGDRPEAQGTERGRPSDSPRADRATVEGDRPPEAPGRPEFMRDRIRRDRFGDGEGSPPPPWMRDNGDRLPPPPPPPER